MMVRAENENGSECFEKCNRDTSSHRSWRNLWMRHSSHDLDTEFSQPAVRWCWADARPLDLILKLKGCHLIKSTGKQHHSFCILRIALRFHVRMDGNRVTSLNLYIRLMICSGNSDVYQSQIILFSLLKVKWKCQLLICVWLCDPMTCSLPGFSVEFSKQILEWVAVPSPGDLPDVGIEPGSLAFQADSLTSNPPRKPNHPF